MAESEHRHLFCDCCGERQDFNDGDDGFFYCVLCGTQSQDLIVTQAADEDVLADGGLYNLHLTRSKPKNPNPNPNPRPNAPISREALVRVLSGNDNEQDEDEEKKNIDHHWFDDEVTQPRDIGSGSVPDPGGEGIRSNYVGGLQVILERQCEALVEKFGVSPLIVGIMPQIWLRYVAATRVFAEDWAESVIKESEEELRFSSYTYRYKWSAAFFMTCNRHRLSTYNHLRAFLQRLAHLTRLTPNRCSCRRMPQLEHYEEIQDDYKECDRCK